MQALARVLGIAEVVLVPIAVLSLLAAAVAPSRARTRAATAFAVFLAITVAQPFGLVIHQRPAPPPGAHRVSTTGVHVARLFGTIPILPFALYLENQVTTGENGPGGALKARSWFWLPVLTNATRIERICSNYVAEPCPQALHGPRSGVRLLEQDGRYYVTVLNPQGPRYQAPASFTWEVAPGIPSLGGLAYWVAVALLGPLALLRTRRILHEGGDLSAQAADA